MTLQFVLLKPLLAAMPFFFWLAGVAYEEHQYYDLETKSVDWTSPKLYVLMVANISVSLAFYGLLSFYHTTEKGINLYIGEEGVVQYAMVVFCLLINIGISPASCLLFLFHSSDLAWCDPWPKFVCIKVMRHVPKNI